MATTIDADKTRPALPISSRTDCQATSPILTDDDVNKILKRKLGDSVFLLVAWRLEPLENSKGFLGRYYHLRITATVDGKTESLRFFVKTPPLASSPQYGFLERYDTFNKEVAFYVDLSRRMGRGGPPKWMVECYLCKRDNVIVLEDASMDGYVVPDKFTPFDEEHCVWLLKTFSRLHSRFLILDEKLRRQEGRTAFDLYGHLLNEVLFVEGDDKSEMILASAVLTLNGMLDLVEGLDDDGRIVVQRRVAEWTRNISQLLGPSDRYRNVICHRDIWANNLMIRYDRAGNPNGCYIIDFQFFVYCPPAIDFACCLYLNTDRATRDRHFDSFARIYYDSLSRELAGEGLDVEVCLPWMEFQRSYAEARNVALIYAILNLQIMLIPNERIPSIMSDANKLEEYIYKEGRLNMVRKFCETIPEYKARLSELILEIRDLPERPSNP